MDFVFFINGELSSYHVAINYVAVACGCGCMYYFIIVVVVVPTVCIGHEKY